MCCKDEWQWASDFILHPPALCFGVKFRGCHGRIEDWGCVVIKSFFSSNSVPAGGFIEGSLDCKVIRMAFQKGLMMPMRLAVFHVKERRQLPSSRMMAYVLDVYTWQDGALSGIYCHRQVSVPGRNHCYCLIQRCTWPFLLVLSLLLKTLNENFEAEWSAMQIRAKWWVFSPLFEIKT